MCFSSVCSAFGTDYWLQHNFWHLLAQLGIPWAPLATPWAPFGYPWASIGDPWCYFERPVDDLRHHRATPGYQFGTLWTHLGSHLYHDGNMFRKRSKRSLLLVSFLTCFPEGCICNPYTPVQSKHRFWHNFQYDFPDLKKQKLKSVFGLHRRVRIAYEPIPWKA